MASLAMSKSSRRDFIAALLGVPWALEGCRSKDAPLPDGELLAPGKALGHRLRDGGLPLEASRSTPITRARVAIVGAGAAGLAAAWWLDRVGVQDLLVLELDDVVGGTARSGA